MNYRVGQRVRWLHESGEGVISSLIDKRTVEVDFGDGFPMDVDIDEIIPVDQTEGIYLSRDDEKAKPAEPTPRVMGTRLFVVSLGVVKEGSGYSFFVINPEPTEVLFGCYVRRKGKLEGIASGKVASNDFTQVLFLSEQNLLEIKGFYFQFLNYVNGVGHPHQPFAYDLPWSRTQLAEPAAPVAWMGVSGWTFPLRQDRFTQDVNKTPESEFIRIRQTEQTVVKPEPIVDLHIEELTRDFQRLTPNEMLRIQVQHMEKSLSDALTQGHDSMIFIHGVGLGVLKQKLLEYTRRLDSVAKTEPGDPLRFGQGATRVVFKAKT